MGARASTPRRVNSDSRRAARRATFYITPPAIAFDVSSLDDAERVGARYVEVTDAESERTYRAAIATIRTCGFELNRNFGNQIALPMSEWACDDEPMLEQLSLWQVTYG